MRSIDAGMGNEGCILRTFIVSNQAEFLAERNSLIDMLRKSACIHVHYTVT
jgi:hypothetical protein